MDKACTKAHLHYIPSFNGLRAFATLIVMILHGGYGYFRGGWVGVDLFFVISGYLITSILQAEFLQTNKISFPKFYWRRSLRLIPPLLICVVLANILWPYTLFDFAGSNREQATLAALFYYTNMVASNVNGNMLHLWSLSVEEHFYFIWPLLLSFFLLKASARNRIIILLTAIALITILRICVFQYREQLVFGIFNIDPYTFTICRMDAILIGALIAIVTSRPGAELPDTLSNKSALILFVCFSLFMVILFTLSSQNETWNNGGFVFTNLLCATTVLTAIASPDHPLLSNKVFSWLGKRSYGTYIYHFPIFLVLERFRLPHDIPNLLLITFLRFGTSIAIAALSYAYIERPLSLFKDRIPFLRRRNKVALPKTN
ncbi:acyltransferase family protein [Mucilaginibacter psychrotolerans]|uniref:Acyltransferase n=1 Tax=Mucilaginibacter psychrotolerans TaxID=1524096 RepID=A0A4Y8SE79_9SPHI|nr:acyltransferase [Mucilaginibacter psychrotolerans]TFF36877.1 acyltransferase [Mucilaginibacter psychrotolerans]